MSVIAGAQRFPHTNQLGADRALHALLGMKRFPSDEAILNYFRRFRQAGVERFWPPLWRWLISRLPQLEKGCRLDLDSTIFLGMAPSDKEAPDLTDRVDKSLCHQLPRLPAGNLTRLQCGSDCRVPP